ncbi:hypothetical protein EVAR_62902_1 [Eumeta japonica]|uniref:Uncharacterized protein n=1 Tax=Eumeta variegata TaxID=151549 RepID=A0A4C1Y6X3_EUMVA|nr:hypothetical protein EVAR_62902_1 [Eumeta japonica]
MERALKLALLPESLRVGFYIADRQQSTELRGVPLCCASVHSVIKARDTLRRHTGQTYRLHPFAAHDQYAIQRQGFCAGALAGGPARGQCSFPRR